jgi:Na+-transporting NADH:ubiquinone oxidoreductase subunit NqrC
MSGGKDGRRRTSRAMTLLLAALAISLVLGTALVVINRSPTSDVAALNRFGPLTDEQARDQVVDSARQIVAVAQLREATGGYIFLSCKNEHDPPYQAAAYLNFRLSGTNSVKQIREIAAAMVAHGWKEAPSMGEHFGRKLTKNGVTATFHRNLDDAEFGIMRIYGECRNLTDHRNDNPAWTDIADQLS